ncbi:hypothetical protein LJK88_02905 [Paenibacillus sp. P26]|nr:hypothetical protein LJK88_02905 [Paenibacillus sp. P26]
MKKFVLAAVLALPLLLTWTPSARADLVQPPEPLRIPPVILLLKDTPYYDNVEQDYPDHPAGVLSPQDVQVLAGQNGWSQERNRWKVRTPQGEKWIVTEPGTFDVPPPETLTLLEETPIYASIDDKEPSAILSPQNIHVVSAEKLWFYQHDATDPVWLKISTTWLGDQ